MSAKGSAKRIVAAHDYLTQRGGAERVTLEVTRALKPSHIVTSLYSPDNTFPEFKGIEICASFLNSVPPFRRDPRLAFPFLAASWSNRRPVDADAVVCSSSGWAHALPVTPGTRKIVYCHNPARWLYQTDDYFLGRSNSFRHIFELFKPKLIDWDRRAAASADFYIANSTSVAERIRRAYGREPEILFPPVSVDPLGSSEPIKGLEPPFFLTVGRSRGYKGTKVLAEAFSRTPEHKLVVTGADTLGNIAPNVRPVGLVSDAQLRWLYKNARALVSVSREDFGLTPIEANAFGTPALLLRAGGFLDSTLEGVSGLFIDEPTLECIVHAIASFPDKWDKTAIFRHSNTFSPEKFAARLRAIVEQVTAS
ncbi:glycosyltransferase involved in cell wall biosynthesis [Rhodoligotrophos appendicifer]|uniref:glycosyltransferase n=1 Tax=Rhodoligotrophos appendicifer TaxID=987056 RepID=UPI001185FDF4|nr:glycosyltransferase [Rhodoligotrophos appendicifer]